MSIISHFRFSHTFLFIGSEEIQAKKKSEAHKSAASGRAVQKEFGRTLADLPASALILLRNPTFMFLNLAGASDGELNEMKMND